MRKLDHLPALSALLPLATLCKVHQQACVWVARTKADVRGMLALVTRLGLAEAASADASLDLCWADGIATVRGRTVRGIRRSKFFDLEAEILDELFGQQCVADVQGNWDATMSRKQCSTLH